MTAAALLLQILTGAAFAYAAWAVGYVLVFALAGRLKRPITFPEASGPRPRVAVLIPAYREDAVIEAATAEALRQDYPPDRFTVVVIADGLQPRTLGRLRRLGATVLQVTFETSTKAKALKAALGQLDGTAYDLAVVLDADNVMAPDALRRFADAHATGLRALQGRRTAKNLDTPLARLDALSEAVNNHVFRLGHRALGLSAALIGSGMAFEYRLFKKLMQRATAVGGFDKELELALLRRRIRIGYVPEAVVYDEKVDRPDRFVTQRRRWLSAQAHYARRALGPGLKALVTGRWDYADKALQQLLPPRALLLAALPAAALVALLAGQTGWAIAWGSLLLALALALVLSLPAWARLGDLFRALGALPRGVALMAWALLKSPGSNKTFLHTPHGDA